MANLREIRNRISSIKSTQQITKAMKMVAAAKLRKAQQKMLNNRPYAGKLAEILGRLSATTDASELHPLFSRPADAKSEVLYIAVGSDRGLCGAFNNNLIKFIEQHIQQHNFSPEQVKVVAIGRKMTQYFKKRPYNLIDTHEGFFDKLNYADTAVIAYEATKAFEAGAYHDVFLAFNEFKSVIAQNRIVENLLPVQPVVATEESPKSNTDYIYEKDQASILKELVPKHISVQLWKAVLESNAAEQGARMAAMDNATENAKELEKGLKLQYNRARQDSITTELSEIVSGAAALENG